MLRCEISLVDVIPLVYNDNLTSRSEQKDNRSWPQSLEFLRRKIKNDVGTK